MASEVSTVRVYRFGSFALDARTGELTTADGRVALRGQPHQLLLALLERPGELITREELTSRVWPAGTFVDYDRGLNKVVNHLRDVLGDSADSPVFIETLPRKGYRFIAAVSHDASDREPLIAPAAGAPVRRRWIRAAAVLAIAAAMAVAARVDVRRWMSKRWSSPPTIAALAVLPLENLSRDPEQEYFADGMTDALITNLARMSSLRITSRTSVVRYKGTTKSVKDIGGELDVDAVVEGTVTRAGDRVRITAQLIQVSTDMHLWADTYERDVSELVDLQSALATDIARRINAVVRPLEPARTVDAEAYGLYLKGRYSFHQYTSEGWQRAIQHFNQAIARDPKFALAYAALADAYLVAGAYESLPAEEALTRGKAAAATALQLDDTLAGAHYALATAYTWYDWDWDGAEREFTRALELNPNDPLGRNWYGGYLSLRGRHDRAIEEHERARELDPLSLIVNANLTRSLYWARRFDDAIAQARRTLEIDPQFSVALFWLEGALRHRQLFKDAVAVRQAVATPEQAAIIGRTFDAAGFTPLLRQTGETMKQAGSLVTAARCYAQLGDVDEALSLLESCAERRCSQLVTLPVEPDFDRLRSDPRFLRLLRTVGGS